MKGGEYENTVLESELAESEDYSVDTAADGGEVNRLLLQKCV